jgi:regulator of ribonuclease activity A
MEPRTTDLSDAHPDLVQIVDPGLKDFGGRGLFHGPLSTVQAPEDNSLVREALEEPGEGRVLVIDGGGSMKCALLGDLLGALAVKNGWSGVVVNGCVRDAEVLATLPLGIKALATHPRKSDKRQQGQREVPVRFGGVLFVPGDWLYADADGVLTAPRALHGGAKAAAATDEPE